jgi:hypothetical protein
VWGVQANQLLKRVSPHVVIGLKDWFLAADWLTYANAYMLVKVIVLVGLAACGCALGLIGLRHFNSSYRWGAESVNRILGKQSVSMRKKADN